jgi:hypothetical protein
MFQAQPLRVYSHTWKKHDFLVDQVWASLFSVTGHMVNIIFWAMSVFIAQVTIDSIQMNECCCVSIKLYKNGQNDGLVHCQPFS